ncbi:MAG: O-antigen ligase family protein [Deltaproteobacteria bacterium]|nr:O-antigen ligase family protein [Deltaproteobacteria bacterium]
MTVFMIPWEEFIVVGGFGGLIRFFGYAVLALALPTVFMGRRIRPPTVFFILMGAFLAWNLLTLAWMRDPEIGQTRVLTFLRLGGLVWLIYEFSDEFGDVLVLLQAYVWGSYFAVAFLFLAPTVMVDAAGSDAKRLTAVGMNHNDLALVLALGFGMAYYLVASGQIKSRVLRAVYWAFCPISAIAITLTGSRGGVAALFTGATFFFVVRTASRRKRVAFVTLAVIGLVVALQVVPEATLGRLASTGQEIRGGTMTGRLNIWAAGLRVFAENPFLGVGSGMFALEAEKYLGMRYHSHNTFLAVLVEGGIVGFALFMLMGFYVLRLASAMPVREKNAWRAILLTWAVGSFGLGWDYRKPTWMLLGLIVVSAVHVGTYLQKAPLSRAKRVSAAKPAVLSGGSGCAAGVR